MKEAKCGVCRFFVQHYGLNNQKFFRLCCGHCTFSAAKGRRPDAKACENFIPGPDDTDAFASKEYLSKELLQYVLHLSLLPEIEDIPTPPDYNGCKKRP